MGYQLKLVISSPVSAEIRAAVMEAAFARWPYCRGPRDPDVSTDRAVFAPPELTGYLYDSPDDYEQAVVQAEEVEYGLLEWSRKFPDVTFAFVEADCFGGHCEYYGFCCRNGLKSLSYDRQDDDSLVNLLDGVGIANTDPFAPFVRGFFAGRGSGGFD